MFNCWLCKYLAKSSPIGEVANLTKHGTEVWLLSETCLQYTGQATGAALMFVCLQRAVINQI